MSQSPQTELDNFYHSLEPHGYGDHGVEEWEKYELRIKPLLPNFPSQVLQDWIYRHYDDAVRVYGWLDFRRLQFEQNIWQTELIVQRLRPFNERLVDGWKKVFVEGGRQGLGHRRSKLGAFMIEHGSWPIPPIVMANSSALITPDGSTFHPYHLIEGHHRLAYLRALAQMGEPTLQLQHKIWIIQIA